MKRPRLSVIWRARHETARQNAVRMGKLLADLSAIDDCFSTWLKTGSSRKAALRPAWQMPPDIDELTRVFEKANHRDLAGKITDMAFGAWNGREDDKPASLSFMGNMGPGGNQLLPNGFEIVLPSLLEDGKPMPIAAYRAILCAAVEAWGADFGSISPFADKPPIGETIPRPRFWSGWMSYFTAEFAAWFVPPPGVIVEPGPAGGRLVQLTKEPFDKSNPAHEAAADAMYRTLAASFERLPTFGTAQVEAARAMLGWA